MSVWFILEMQRVPVASLVSIDIVLTSDKERVGGGLLFLNEAACKFVL